LAEFASRGQKPELMLDVLDRIRVSRADPAPAGVLARLAELAVNNNSSSAGMLIRTALDQQGLPPTTREMLETLSRFEEVRRMSPDPPSDPVLINGLRRAEDFKVLEGIPREINDETLTVDLSEGRRRLALGSIQAVAVGAVSRPGDRPFIVVDLLLDPPSEEEGDLRSLRLVSTRFDPKILVGGDDSMGAFRRLLELLLDRSGAMSLPDRSVVSEGKIKTFASLEDYQHEVLRVEK
jgi:hypothetical protein